MTKDQVWEFSHPQFLRGRSDLLDGIKRKAMDTDMYRREAGDMYGQISMLQVAQADIFKQLSQLQLTVSQLSQQLGQSLTAQGDQANLIKVMMETMSKHGIPGKLHLRMYVMDLIVPLRHTKLWHFSAKLKI
jgi:hypothetical protein